MPCHKRRSLISLRNSILTSPAYERYRRPVKGSTSFHPPRGCAWTCLILGAVLVVLGILSLLAIPKVWARAQEVWTETPGTVAESYLEEGSRVHKSHRSSSDVRTFNPRLKYRYRTGDRDLTGDARAPRQPADDEDKEEAETIAESYRAGDALPVFHHPADAGKSRLTAKEPRIEFWLDAVFGVLFLVSGALLLGFARVLLRRKRQEAQKDPGLGNLNPPG